MKASYDKKFKYLLTVFSDNHSIQSLLKEARTYHKGDMGRTLNYLAMMVPVSASQAWEKLILKGWA
jgi:protein-disulfide isomerase